MNLYNHILQYGHDLHFVPQAKSDPTDAAPGSEEKIRILQQRIEDGQPLWNEFDRADYSGLTAAIRPREVKV